uniref:Synaptotagmin-like protein 2 n=1 Tax=Hucho hucho TaxID=62062 RepID=A0A4W5QDS9_9TELE
MIDLSHLTEEEQSMIMTVLKRDEELKKAEEERIKQLQKTSAPVGSRLKYLTGEWFYEAKSLRHREKIHGSEVILASMKQRKAGSLDGSLSRPRAVSGKVSDITPPPKPARLLEAPTQPTQPQKNSKSLSVSDAEKERLNSVVQSPGRPRHNPFNRASLILEVEKTEKQSNGNQEAEKASEAEPLSPLNIHMTADSTSHNSAGSATSEGSSLGFRPVPKKITILSRHSQSSLTGSDVSVPGQQGHPAGSKVIAPAPQGSLQHGSSCGSNQSSQGALDVQSQKMYPTPISELQNNVTPVSPSSQQLNTLSHLSHKPLKHLTLVSANTEFEREKEANERERRAEPSDNSLVRHLVRTPSPLRETESTKVPLRPLSEPKPLRLLDLRPATHSDNDRHTDKSYTGHQKSESSDGLIQRKFVSVGPQGRERSDGPFSKPLSMPLSPSSELTAPTHHQPSQHAAFQLIEMQDKEMIRTRNVDTAIRQEDLSLPPSTVDHWKHHDLHNSGDKPDKHVHKKTVGSKPASKSAPRSPQPTGEQGDSISKVLEWFSRSTDSNAWLETESDQPDMEEDVIGSVKTDTDDRPTFESRSQQTERKAPEVKRKLLHVDPSLDMQSIGEGVSVCLTPEVKDGSRSESSMDQPMDQSPLNTLRSYQPKRHMSESEGLRAAYRKEFKQVMLDREEDVIDRQEDVKEVSGPPAKAVGPQVTTQEVRQKEEVQDENQPPKITHLKSFWEKGNTGPKVLISRSIIDKGQKPMEKEKDRALAEKSHRTVSGPESYGVEGSSRKNLRDEKGDKRLNLDTQQSTASRDMRSVQPSVSPYKQEIHRPQNSVVIAPSIEIRTLPTWNDSYTPGAQSEEDNLTLTEDDLRRSPMTVDRRSSQAEILYLSRLHPQPDTLSQSRLSPEHQRFSPSTLSPQPELLIQPTVNPQPVKLSPAIPKPQPEMPSRARSTPSPNPLPELLSQPTTSPGSEKFRHKVGKESEQFSLKTQQSNVNVHSSVSTKKQDHTFKDKGNSPHTLKQVPPQQDSKADNIKQLKSFWEQEKNRPIFYTGKSKEAGDASVTQIPSSAIGKLNKRFTKSEFDLRSICNESDGDHEGDSNLSSDRKMQNFTVFTMDQRLEKSSPSLGANRSQFKNLCNFWGEATSNNRGSVSSDKLKSPKNKEPMDAQNSTLDLKQCVDPDFYSKSAPSQSQKVSATLPLDQSRLKKPSSLSSPSSPSPPPSLVRGNKDSEHQPRSKSIGAGSGAMIDTKEHQSKSRSVGVGSGAMIDTKANFSPQITIESKQQRAPGVPQVTRGSEQDFTKVEKALKPQSTSGKESRSHKARKDRFGNSSGRASALRRATSMFTLDMNEEQAQTSMLYPKRTLDISHVQPKRTQGRRQSADKHAHPGPRSSSKSSDESESLTPRTRVFVPKDYPHYLEFSEKTSVHTALAPAAKEQREVEERYSKITQRPLALWSNQGSTDTGRETSFSASEIASSSVSETWSNSRTSSNCENDDEDQDPVQKALKRAQARPQNLTKNLEDITASMPPRQERRLAPLDVLRRSSDASTIPSPSSSLHSDPEHLKKMSKSVPSFLQNELSGSVMTMYSGDYGGVEVQGNIQFSINYVQKLKEFHIFVAQCRDLAAVDPKRGRSDPYVKSYLVPDKANTGKRKTSVKKKTVNPIFNELLRYRLLMEYLRTQTLILSVWHHDTFGRNSFLGEVDVDLSKWDFDHTQMNYLALKSRPTSSLQPSDDRGEMKLSIRFLPQVSHSPGKDPPSNKGEVHIWVKDCKNLPLIRGATIDPYVKCFMLPDTSRKSRQKTRVLRRTVEPVFNHTMVLDGFRQEDLKEACVELTVWDRDKLASNLLGGLRLGPGTGRSYGAVVNWMDSNADEVALWERMMTSPNEWVEDVLPLRMLTTAKTVLK